MFYTLASLFLLLAAISIDAFTAGLTYGMNRVSLPFLSTLIMAFMSAILLMISLKTGDLLQNLLTHDFVKYGSFIILLFLGVYRLFDTFLPKTIKKVNQDDLSILSPKEAFLLSLVLSIDNLAAGFGFQIRVFSSLFILTAAFSVNVLIIRTGYLAGHKIRTLTNLDLSWIGAALIILLAFSRFLQ